MKLGRRAVLATGVAAVGVAVLMRSADRSGLRAPYFERLQQALRREGVATPTLVVDRARLEANVDRLRRDLPSGMAYRIVAKSLPAAGLLEAVRARSGSERVMTFNLPMLLELARTMPGVTQFLGKPLPVTAAAAFLAQLPPASRDAAGRVTWLVDTPERVLQYAALAQGQDRVLDVAIELDVGLHRGGQTAGEGLARLLDALKASPGLRFAGLMGYEPHVPAVPALFGLRERALARSWEAYRQATEQVAAALGARRLQGAILNAAGSLTYRLYRDTGVANEVSAGSALVKPAGFDTPLLEAMEPACFIATPVLKALPETRLPDVFGAISTLQALWDPNTRRTVFIHGGHWLARPVDPPGLQYNGLFGRSSNQEMLNAGEALSLRPDDFVFFRPEQSEAVLQQFGDIAVFDGERITGWWPVFPARA